LHALTNIPRIVEEIFELLNLDMYGVVGVLEGEKLLISAFREGALNVYLYRPEEGLVKLNREPVSFVTQPPSGSNRVIIGRDIAKGREIDALYTIRVDRPGVEEPLSSELEPMRILSVVDKSDRVAVTGVTQKGIEVFLAEDGSARSVGTVPGMGALVDMDKNLGYGILFEPTGKISLFTIDLATGESQTHSPPGSVASLSVSPEGWVAVGVERARDAGLYRFDPSSGSFEELHTSGGELERFQPTWILFIDFDPDGRMIVTAGRNGRTRVFVDGEELSGPPGVYGRAVRWREGYAASYSSLNSPSRILLLTNNGHRVLIAADVPEWLSQALGESRTVLVESSDGEKVPTLVLESQRVGKPGPTTVLVHGGPFAADSDSWNIFAAALVLAGYHVVMPNYRGSMTYGEEWRSKILGDPCGMELEDIVAAADWAEKVGLASYTAIMGYSYGGYMTMCALTRKPGRFRAGVAGASVVDWEEMYELSDPLFKQFIDLLFKGNKDLWGERSPISYVENLKDPLCIIHPQNDSRTPLKPVLHFMEKALESSKTFEAHIAPDMGHTVNTINDAIKILLPAILFLARLKDKQEENPRTK